MRYSSAGAFRVALEQRLLNHSREHGVDMDRLRKEVAFDRFLARLQVAAPGQWVLKGGFALQLRLGELTRATRDIDVIHRTEAGDAGEELLAAQAADLDDFFSFAIERKGEIDTGEDARATRYHVVAELDGRIFERFVVDVSASDPLGWRPEQVLGTEWLAFAEIPRTSLPAIPVEQQVAEKLEAYTRTYGPRGASCSRTKDLVDIELIARNETVDAQALAHAIETIFMARRPGASAPPAQLPPPSSDWAVPYATMAQPLGLGPDLASGHSAAAGMVDPVLGGAARGTWSPEARSWSGTKGSRMRVARLEPPRPDEITIRGPRNVLSELQPLFIITIEVPLHNTGDEPVAPTRVEARSAQHGRFMCRVPKSIPAHTSGVLELVPPSPALQEVRAGDRVDVELAYSDNDGGSYALPFSIRRRAEDRWEVLTAAQS
ncbi:MAG: nucleotidyl transferase AbiEii/AbiGii toxin family protein [Solirubrobacteraceae bacterium]